jgi:hypothetical protein
VHIFAKEDNRQCQLGSHARHPERDARLCLAKCIHGYIEDDLQVNCELHARAIQIALPTISQEEAMW